ncbi:MAG: glycosyltransferase [Thermoanaerobaculia bacterium]|nr:glycosyltransferase [Thermoanaerobaculia bacterium]
MSSEPRVSVLLPVHDAREHLDDAIESIERQSFADFEVVAVDDGSTDGSADLLDAWSRRDDRVRWISSHRRGLVGALNLALAAARAPLVARMDADDRCDARRLELQVALLDRKREVTVASCLIRHFPDSQVAEGFRHYERWLNSLVTHEEIWRDRFIESPVPHPSVMARRAALLAVGGYRDVGWPEDYDLWLRLAARGARFEKVPETLLLWRDHAGRLTRTDPRYAVERFLACKAHHLTQGPLLGADGVLLWGAGQTGRRLSKHLARRGAPLAAFLDIDERKIGRTLRGLPIHPVDDLPRLLSAPGRTTVLAAVSSRGARELIRQRLDGLGLVETRDYWCAA